MKVELLKDIHLCDDVPDRLRAEMAVLVSRIKATSTYECQQAMDYFGSNKPPSGATLIELGLDRLYQAIWDREKQVRLGLW